MKCISFRLIMAVVTYFAVMAAPLPAHAAGAINLPATGQPGSTGTAWPSPRATASNSVITDNLTGLVWVQEGNLMATRDSSFDTAGTAGDGLVSWQKALDYIKKLNTESYLGFSDWRLPNVDELASLYDYSRSNPATPLSFTGLGTTYWTSTSYTGDPSQAWAVNLQSPGIGNVGKVNQYGVLPVRGGRVIARSAADSSPPTILAFRLPQTWDSKTVPIQELTLNDDIGVTGFLMSEDATTPAASAAGWKTSYNYTFDASYTFATSGAHTLNVWVKDAAGNISPKASASVTIAESANKLTAYTATIKLPATGQLTSATPGDDGDLKLGVAWPAARFTSVGTWMVSDTLTGLNWVRPGNLITVRDPSYDADGTAGDSLVSWQHALDYVKKLNTESFLGFTDWRLPNVNELASLFVYDSSQVRPFTDLGTTYWTSTSYTGDGTQAWAVNLQSPGISTAGKGTQYGVLPVRGGRVIARSATDSSPPTILAFRLPSTWDSKTVPIQELTLNDDIGVTGFLMSEDATTPTATAAGWKTSYNSTFDASYTFATSGSHTLNVWVKDAAGNISQKASAGVTIAESANQLTAYTATITLPATGQLTSATPGDDGDLKLGVAWPDARFTTVGTWMVSDSLTGLNWVRPGNLITVRNPSFDTDGTTGDSLVSWQHALDYVKKLNTESFLGFTDWRLPNVDELASLFVFESSQVRPFTDLGATYWTSTSYTGDASQAWAVNLQSPGIGNAGKVNQYGVLPVRGGRVIARSATDSSPPTILAFRLPQTWESKTVPIQELTLNDDIGVTGFLMSEDAVTPTATAVGWKTSYNSTFDATYTFATSGAHTLNVWVKDAAGNISQKASAGVAIAENNTTHSTTIKLPATGQLTSTTPGDDGDLQRGVAWPANRFTTIGSWIVSDNMTTLSWVRPGNLITVRDPSFDTDGTTGDGMVGWQSALDYVKKLNSDGFLGFSDWRLPNVNELASLFVYDSSQVRPFSDLGTTYWTSTSYTGDPAQAWVVNLQNPGITPAGKASQYSVLPVRGGLVGTLASLSVLKQGSGFGSVISQPAAIDCGATCGVLLDHVGAALGLSQLAGTGSAFTGWGGACSGVGSCAVTLNGDVGVVANFNLLRTVTVNKSGTGGAVMTSFPAGLNCGSTCSAQFPDTNVVTITAVLPETSVVASWSGCDTSSDTQCTITINGADRQVGVFLASKNATTLSLSLSSSAILNNGSAIASGKLTRLPDNGTDLSGQIVSVTVTPPAGTSPQPFTVTATTDATGHYSSAPITGFTQRGAYTLQASSVATSTITAAISSPSSLLVGAQAGYAIIVQGKYPTGEGLAEHAKTANRIYKTLKSRGFNDDSINYLSYQDAAGSTAAGVTVDGIPSRAAIQNAITIWAKDRMNSVPAPLWIMMVDHGTSGNFIINYETVTPGDLNSWLATLESATGTTEKRIVIDGSCYSGTFIPALAKAGRIIITSAAANEESYRGPLEPDGIRSGEYFLDSLFGQLKRGMSLKDAFDVSSHSTRTLTRKGNATNGSGYGDTAVQHPLIDDDASGHGNTYTSENGDGALSAALYLGTGQTITNAGEPADIKEITPTTTLISGVPDQQLWLSTYGGASNVDTAWAEIRSPGVTLSGAGGTATMQLTIDLPKLPMTFDSATNRWKTVLAPYAGTAFTGFGTPGTYEIFYYTRDLSGTIFTKRGVVYRQTDSNSVPNPFNLAAPADATTQKTNMLLSWNAATDPDGDPLTYTVLVSRDNSFSTIDYKLEELTDPVAVIGSDAALADLTTYYWRVRAIDQYGGIRYSTQAWSFRTDNTNGLPAIIIGYIRNDATGAPLSSATYRIGSGSTNAVLPSGAFLEMLSTGATTLAVSATGYTGKTVNLMLTPGSVTENNFYLSPDTGATPINGDCDNNGTVTIVEVQKAINMFLGVKAAESCVDTDGAGGVTISEVQKVINSFLGL